jgi:hypothetical protein
LNRWAQERTSADRPSSWTTLPLAYRRHRPTAWTTRTTARGPGDGQLPPTHSAREPATAAGRMAAAQTAAGNCRRILKAQAPIINSSRVAALRKTILLEPRCLDLGPWTLSPLFPAYFSVKRYR